MNETKSMNESYPRAVFSGDIITVTKDQEIPKALERLMESDAHILGFDTETKPAFKKGESYRVSLLQLSTDKVAVLFRLHYLHEFSQIKEIFENENIVKTGVAIRDDIKSLQQLFKFTPNAFVELATVAKESGLKNMGLKGMTEEALGETLSKKAKLTNWQAKELTEEQKVYAATDAWIGRKLYIKLVK